MSKAKYNKVVYHIVGRFENGANYDILTRKLVEGYTVEGYPGVALRKQDKKCGLWGLDHIASGLAVVRQEYKSRERALARYNDLGRQNVEAISEEALRKMEMRRDEYPLEEEVARWVTLSLVTKNSYRFDRITRTARNMGLLVRMDPVVNAGYLSGGEALIIGLPVKVEQIEKLMAE